MRSNNYKSVLKHAGLAASVLLLASGAAFAQQQVNLTAAPATATMPDGTAVPMWGYSCDATQVAGTTASCTALNKAVAAAALTTTPLVGVGTPPTQGPRVQSFSTEVPAGATAVSLTWTAPRPGTYLIESGTHPSIQGPMGLYGIVVVTAAPAGATAGTAYPAVGTTPAVSYNADIPLLLSEIDPVQNAAVSAAVNTAGFAETNVW